MANCRLLRTLRFDGTDTFVFEHAAAPDEWAVSGAFAFADRDRATVTGKLRQAFANGFLSVESFGRSTFVCVGEIGTTERTRLEHVLAQHFVDDYGAPDLDAALPAARAEFDFVAGLAHDLPINTVIVVHREFDKDGEIREQFRTIEKRIDGGPIYARAWESDDAG
ncbi:MAG: DUF6505 family protein [Hyphomicrobiaceae bacterium]